MWDRWDKDIAARYERWYESPAGRFALGAEQRLLGKLVATWPRRHQTLLEIGCGTGRFLNFFWDAGFAVTGIDASREMLAVARKRIDRRIPLQLADGARLPYHDNEFDFCALITVLEFCSDPKQVVREACRVSRKGVLVGFVNKFSLYYCATGIRWPWRPPSPLNKANWFTARRMRQMLRAVEGNRPIRGGSVLPGPMWTWRNKPGFRHVNGVTVPWHLGAFCALQMDLLGQPARTPLAALLRERCSSGKEGLQPVAHSQRVAGRRFRL